MRRNRLTERDLSRIVKRVVVEQENSSNDDMRNKTFEEYLDRVSIKLRDIFEEVVDALDELGGYDDSMKMKAMKLSQNIFDIMSENLGYISEDYEEQLHEILGEKDEDYDEDEEF